MNFIVISYRDDQNDHDSIDLCFLLITPPYSMQHLFKKYFKKNLAVHLILRLYLGWKKERRKLILYTRCQCGSLPQSRKDVK